jgi:hypothetical protein
MPAPSGQIPPPGARRENEAPTTRAACSSAQVARLVDRSAYRLWPRGRPRRRGDDGASRRPDRGQGRHSPVDRRPGPVGSASTSPRLCHPPSTIPHVTVPPPCALPAAPVRPQARPGAGRVGPAPGRKIPRARPSPRTPNRAVPELPRAQESEGPGVPPLSRPHPSRAGREGQRRPRGPGGVRGLRKLVGRAEAKGLPRRRPAPHLARQARDPAAVCPLRRPGSGRTPLGSR